MLHTFRFFFRTRAFIKWALTTLHAKRRDNECYTKQGSLDYNGAEQRRPALGVPQREKGHAHPPNRSHDCQLYAEAAAAATATTKLIILSTLERGFSLVHVPARREVRRTECTEKKTREKPR